MNGTAVSTITSATTTRSAPYKGTERAKSGTKARSLPLRLAPQDSSVPYDEAVRRTSQLVLLLMEADDQRRAAHTQRERRIKP
ncbi:MAG: hypothetical protein V4671_23895 [Armatimonadota bacterium]